MSLPHCNKSEIALASMFSFRSVKPLLIRKGHYLSCSRSTCWLELQSKAAWTNETIFFSLKGAVLIPLEGTISAKSYLVFSHARHMPTTPDSSQSVKKPSTSNSKCFVIRGVPLQCSTLQQNWTATAAKQMTISKFFLHAVWHCHKGLKVGISEK